MALIDAVEEAGYEAAAQRTTHSHESPRLYDRRQVLQKR